MEAMRQLEPGGPLVLQQLPDPEPEPGQVRIRIKACGVCRTDLHVVDGELPSRRLPITPGHEVVGVIDRMGVGVTGLTLGDRVGVGWLGAACGTCEYCAGGEENLCDAPGFTGYTLDGGFATHMLADARFVYPLNSRLSDVEAAPLLCAGLIGWRSLRFTQGAPLLGLYGFGAAGHIVLQAAKAQGKSVYAFTRPGDAQAQALARSLGAEWAGGSDEAPPEPLDAAIIYAPVGDLVPRALRNVRKGGRVVCAGIHMSDIPQFPYALLWGERSVVSVANLTRRDAEEFLDFASDHVFSVKTQAYALAEANEALAALREGRVAGAAVLVPSP